MIDTSPNRAYQASVLLTFAQIPLRGTSDTLGTLYEILNPAFKKIKYMLGTMYLTLL